MSRRRTITSRAAPRRNGAGLLGAAAAGVTVLGASYWVCMSPFAQLLGRFPYRGRSTRRLVALSFDDGPNEPYTSQIADYLDGQGIPATFFQVGKAVARYPDVTRRLIASGHVIGHHGHSHQFSRYLRRTSLDKDIRAATAVFAELGIRPALYRPPWLLRIPAFAGIMDTHGLHAVSGEFCHPLEVLQINPERIARAALAKTRPGTILIFHDGFDGHAGNRASTVAAVKLVVERLLADGYTFTTVDRLLDLPASRAAEEQLA